MLISTHGKVVCARQILRDILIQPWADSWIDEGGADITWAALRWICDQVEAFGS